MGIAPGDRIVVALPAGIDFVAAFWGALWAGATPCALDPGAPAPTLAGRVLRARPALVLADDAIAAPLAGPLADAAVRVARLGEVDGGDGVRPPAAVGEDASAFLQATSGTTGEPRLAVVAHRHALASLRMAAEFLEASERDVLVGWVPPWHDLGLLRFVLAPVAFGAACHLVPPAIRTLPEWLATVATVGATLTAAPDFAYRLATRLVAPDGLDLRSLRLATNGAEPVRARTIADFERRFAAPGIVRPGYGLAEATLGVTAVRAGEALRVDARGNVSCGRPLAGVELRVVGEAGDDAAPGASGEILVRSPAVFAGYLDDPAGTAAALAGGWLHTGDIGAVDADGHLYVLGRGRALLKRGGAALAPRELEEAAERVAGVRLAAAFAMPRLAAGTEGIAVAVEVGRDLLAPAESLGTSVAAAVAAAVGFAPEQVIVLPPRTVPRTANGKLRYDELRARSAAGTLAAAALAVVGAGGA